MTELEQLEIQKKSNLDFIKRKELVERLQNNREFKKVILEDFCEKECAAYAKASADPNLSAEDRADALALAQAAGHLQRYLHVAIRMGVAAENQMAELDKTIDEVRANG